MATLAVTDDADGTGATATIAASSGAANAVYVRAATAAPGAAWTLAGSRTGDGTVALALAAGVWWCYLLSGAAVGQPVLVTVTTGEVSLPTLIRQAVAERIVGLNLPAAFGVPALAGRVYSQIIPDESNVAFPCVILTSDGQAERVRDRWTHGKVMDYPVKVMLCDRHGKFGHGKLPGYEQWRDRVVQSFLDADLSAVCSPGKVSVEPLVIVDPQLPLWQHLVSGLVLRVAAARMRS